MVVSPRSLLEIQILRPHLRPAELDAGDFLAFMQFSKDRVVCVLGLIEQVMVLAIALLFFVVERWSEGSAGLEECEEKRLWSFHLYWQTYIDLQGLSLHYYFFLYVFSLYISIILLNLWNPWLRIWCPRFQSKFTVYCLPVWGLCLAF